MVMNVDEERRRKWSFDFRRGSPLQGGSYEWQVVSRSPLTSPPIFSPFSSPPFSSPLYPSPPFTPPPPTSPTSTSFSCTSSDRPHPSFSTSPPPTLFSQSRLQLSNSVNCSTCLLTLSALKDNSTNLQSFPESCCNSTSSHKSLKHLPLKLLVRKRSGKNPSRKLNFDPPPQRIHLSTLNNNIGNNINNINNKNINNNSIKNNFDNDTDKHLNTNENSINSMATDPDTCKLSLQHHFLQLSIDSHELPVKKLKPLSKEDTSPNSTNIELITDYFVKRKKWIRKN